MANFSYKISHHLGETLSHQIHVTLHLVALREIIKLSSFSKMPSDILRNTKYYSWFKDCTVAVDVIHIPAILQ